jgi:hypothetical protein
MTTIQGMMILKRIGVTFSVRVEAVIEDVFKDICCMPPA